MKQGAREVLLALEEELGLLGDLLGFAREKNRLLSRADAQGLEKLLAQEEETVVALREKEKMRIKCAEHLARCIGVPDERPTLRELSESMPDTEYARRLTEAGGRLLQTARALNRQSEKARRLLGHRLRYTDFMLTMLSRPGADTHVYNMRGDREEQSGFLSLADYYA